MALMCVGAMLGDIAGSQYEWHNIKHKPQELITSNSSFTDDTVLTYAIALGTMAGLERVDRKTLLTDGSAQKIVSAEIARSVKALARSYPDAGYGGSFLRWLHSDTFDPYGSWGNGSAMRASFPGWVAYSLAEAELLGRLSAEVTHNHPLGIKGAVVVAGGIFLLRQGRSKAELAAYVQQYYHIPSLDEIRPGYAFDVSCEGSVPQAIAAFLEGTSFEDVLRLAISIGGDSDTIAAIAGSIAEAAYPVPLPLLERGLAKLDNFLRETVERVSGYLKIKARR
ncbi:MAG: ADP-ribosylglycohydrolase family protein [Bacillota bacterium]|jgi:ADP-ribosyl-[dinitrogen reductase] hydrolase